LITAREIAAWRAVAPWATDMMVEQEYLLCRAVAAIFEDDFLSKLQALMNGKLDKVGASMYGRSRPMGMMTAGFHFS
jgi:hypothetical protein